ncbi:MAG: hypothetical protein AAF654_00780 [Myxococcota bacterium]
MNTLLLLAALVAAKPSVVVLQTQSGSLEVRQLKVLTRVLTYELSSHGKHDVVTMQDIEAQLGVENTKEMMGCDEVRCAAEIGMALNARYMLSSYAEPLGGSLFYSLNLIDGKTNQTLRSQAKVPDKEVHYETAVRVALNELLNPEIRRVRPLSDKELAVSYSESLERPKPPRPRSRNTPPRPAQIPEVVDVPEEMTQPLDEIRPVCSALDLSRTRSRAATMLEILRSNQVPADDWPGAMATLGKYYVELATCASSPNERRRSQMQAVGIFETLLKKRPNYRERPLIERYQGFLRRPPSR